MRRMVLALLILLALALGTLSCGKKGPPIPPEARAQAVIRVTH
jgi:predicted small lipoprotein YifL